MSKYIDKSVLVEKIKKRINEINLDSIDDWRYRLQREHDIEIMKNILSLIDTIAVKEVDLKKEIKNRKDNLCNLYCYMEDLFNGKEEDVYPIPENVTNELYDFARYFFELGLKTQNENKL